MVFLEKKKMLRRKKFIRHCLANSEQEATLTQKGRINVET